MMLLLPHSGGGGDLGGEALIQHGTGLYLRTALK